MSTFLSRMPGGSKQPDPVDVVADILRNLDIVPDEVNEALEAVYGEKVIDAARVKLLAEAAS